ncbi:Uncharacterised protein [Mycobacteroides abscessus subsp. abscessus]|nr:Uncharacterised protein [Mycobacteroides abscessus subsp. abscessus]
MLQYLVWKSLYWPFWLLKRSGWNAARYKEKRPACLLFGKVSIFGGCLSVIVCYSSFTPNWRLWGSIS